MHTHTHSHIIFATGGDKLWWLRPTAITVDRWYLLALLRTDVHKKAVPHLEASGYYQALVQGRPYTQRKQTQFAFSATVDVEQPRPKRPRRACARRGGGAIPNLFIDVADEEAALLGDDDSEVSNASNASGGDDTDSSSSSSSSSSKNSSSSSSTSSSADGEDGGCGGSGGAGSSQSVFPQDPAASSSSGTRAVQAQNLMTDNIKWKGFRFTRVFDKFVPVGWETECFIPSHRLQGQRCRRNRTMKSSGGEEICQRKLKWWCLQGALKNSKDAHKAVPDLPDGGTDGLPTLEELDSHSFEAW
jgi:hypothetical protein